ncbi:MAG: GTPase HflX [Planctomycetes bacterium]|nr:GTPase HflX [Planctomycetota bacterium]
METLREQLQVRKERAILVGANLRVRGASSADRTTNHRNLAELTALAESAGAIVVDRFHQQISRINPATYIGKGKAERLRGRVKRFESDVVIFDNDLSPGQIRELEKIIEIKVVDRSELILDIFASRAKTRQARLQVELAQLQYTYPRLTRMWGHLDTLAGAAGATPAGAVGGIGTRGTGEKQLEIDRRLVSKRISELKRTLADIDKRKLREIAGRGGLYKICLVGYTNAGKSTLMNALTDADVLVQDRLFATLDTRTRKWNVDTGAEVLLSDTVGFVNHLPHQLVASFKATLEEAVNADLLLHVVDAANDDAFEQIESVDKVLKEIGCGKKDLIVLLNKTDDLRKKSIIESVQTVYPEALCISAKMGRNLDTIAAAVMQKYQGGQVTVQVTVNAANGKLQNYLRANAKIIKEEYKENNVKIKAKLGKNQLIQLKKLKPKSIDIIED